MSSSGRQVAARGRRRKRTDLSNLPSQLWKWDAVPLAAAIRERQVSSREATLSMLDRLEQVNPKINAVVVTQRASALAAADAADAAVKSGSELGSLHGVPVTTKEGYDQFGVATTHGVVALKDNIAKADSPIIANLRSAGAVMFGRTNTPSFHFRWHTDNDLFGATKNPFDPARTPGGSSGGAAAALAVGIGPISLGGDLGGSVRYPAYCCGVAGIRPSPGRLPIYNWTDPRETTPGVALSRVTGPLARRVADVRLSFRALMTTSHLDPLGVPVPFEGPVLARPARVALATGVAGQTVHPALVTAVRKAGAALADAGYAVEEVELPLVAEAAECCRTIFVNETRHKAAAMFRKFGDAGMISFLERSLETTPDVDLVGYMDALSRRVTLQRQWQVFTERYPVVIAPVSADLPFQAAFNSINPLRLDETAAAQRLLTAFSLLAVPVVAVPVGMHEGIPVGVQVIGHRFRDDVCLDAAEAIERVHGLPTPIDPR